MHKTRLANLLENIKNLINIISNIHIYIAITIDNIGI